MSTIPDLRKRLFAEAAELRAKASDLIVSAMKLEAIAIETYRRKPVSRAKPDAVPMTPQLAHDIIQHKEIFPDVSYRHLAEVYGVNTGRISEVLTGKRT